MKTITTLAVTGLAALGLALPTTVATAAGPASTSDPRVTQAMFDLAQREGVSMTDISITSLQGGTWNDGSLGCAKEGYVYIQALVHGSKLVFSVDGEKYDYHRSDKGSYFYCEAPTGSFRPDALA
ncbi:hypothetical protein ACTQ49_10290 [Luteococcus sp. Sow4_B9]|uniref:hypothetical protein n=1 Tax=Luteococcus sp. Sow4_B9 TaxID=3438792 RepID=UPI003F9CBCBA